MKSLFTIRKKKHVKHPQIIVDANKTKFKSVSLTHSEDTHGHGTENLPNNPNSQDERKSYFVKRFIEDFKFNYSKEFKNYKLSDEDIEKIVEFLKSIQN